ncbi:hypothetical protein AJ79_10232 [Helicocarpus griseus UAMH5409]|uniref:Uncharacterized protein n=1 Tax=Helicocarpus griseus UAMH5409 TaxID=1447875 RepID=A0A2B7WEW8_9EURO|nr:hypothetical protein AJ79_10232 [Helicocarpus griseus UAMH5409]
MPLRLLGSHPQLSGDSRGMVSILSRHDLPISLRIKLLFYQYWSRLTRLRTPFKLRLSLGRLKHNHNRPLLALLKLFIPYQTWHFPIPRQLPPHKLLGNEELMLHRRCDLINLTCYLTLARTRHFTTLPLSSV